MSDQLQADLLSALTRYQQAARGPTVGHLADFVEAHRGERPTAGQVRRELRDLEMLAQVTSQRISGAWRFRLTYLGRQRVAAQIAERGMDVIDKAVAEGKLPG